MKEKEFATSTLCASSQYLGIIKIVGLKINKALSYTIILILFIAYSSFMILGTQARYMQDDYCYGEKVRNEGFFKAQYNSYFGSVPTPGNRYSLTFFAGIFELLSEKSYPFYAFLSTILFISGLTSLLSNISKTFLFNFHTRQILLIALSIAFLTLYISPNRFQALFFRASSLSYFYPIIFNVWIGYFFLEYLITSKKHLLYILALITLFSSGFSEVGAVVQFSLWAFLLSFFIFRKKNKNIILATSIITAVSIIGLVILVLCPNNYERQLNFGYPNTVNNLIKFGPAFALDFIKYSIRGYYIPIFAILLLALFISLQTETPFADFKETIIFALVIILISYLLVIANILPSLYAYRALPDARGLMPSTFILAVTFLLLGLCAGWLFKGKFYRFEHLFNVMQIILVIFLAIYFVHAGIKVFSEYPKYHERASLWDTRHANILEKIKQGEKEILVPAIDGFYRTFELQPDPDHWVNKCAALWYGIDVITADE